MTKTKEILINSETILLNNNLVSLPFINGEHTPSSDVIGTIFSNLAYYGYTFSKSTVHHCMQLSNEQIKSFWPSLELALKTATGDNKKMGDFVVYKNFPQEVLDMSEGEYWVKQIFMYLGFPNDYFVQVENARPNLDDQIQFKVLNFAYADSFTKILNELLKLSARWTNEQELSVKYLIFVNNIPFDLTTISFKENLITLAKDLIKHDFKIDLKSATDVLRLATGLSDGDITLKTISKFKSFSRSERKYILGLLENSSNLEEDMARSVGKWKKLMKKLHVGDYTSKFPKTVKAYDTLFNNKVQSFNGKVEVKILNKDEEVLKLLSFRQGDFVKRLNKLFSTFGELTLTYLIPILPKLKVIQLLKLKKYLTSINDRKNRTFAPKGNWNKVKIFPNTVNINSNYVNKLVPEIDKVLKDKLSEVGAVSLDERTKFVKLQTNDSELSPYGRGTVFPIPDKINFIRSASYWGAPNSSTNIWFDNGWNFFNDKWGSIDAICWDRVNFHNGSAIFSGDPTSSKTADGKACQMIDLYIDKLINAGVRYAVWTILAYSRVPFDGVEDVFASLQWGENALKGKTFEPSRAQLSLPLKGKNMGKYIAYIDLVDRKLVYLDANLKANVSSARNNATFLAETMPSFVENINTLPSVYDLFETNKSEGKIVVYSDENVTIDDEEAYVFKPVNDKNKYKQLDINNLLNL